jgi:hypothetical protein
VFEISDRGLCAIFSFLTFFFQEKPMATEGGKSEGGMDEINIGVVRFDRFLLPLMPSCHV